MPIIPELNAIAFTRPLRSAYHGNTNAPINWPTEPEPIRKPISHGVRCHFAIRIGSVAAVYCLENQGPQPPRYTPEAFRARYVRNYGETPELDRLFA